MYYHFAISFLCNQFYSSSIFLDLLLSPNSWVMSWSNGTKMHYMNWMGTQPAYAYKVATVYLRTDGQWVRLYIPEYRNKYNTVCELPKGEFNYLEKILLRNDISLHYLTRYQHRNLST